MHVIHNVLFILSFLIESFRGKKVTLSPCLISQCILIYNIMTPVSYHQMLEAFCSLFILSSHHVHFSVPLLSAFQLSSLPPSIPPGQGTMQALCPAAGRIQPWTNNITRAAWMPPSPIVLCQRGVNTHVWAQWIVLLCLRHTSHPGSPCMSPELPSQTSPNSVTTLALPSNRNFPSLAGPPHFSFPLAVSLRAWLCF